MIYLLREVRGQRGTGRSYRKISFSLGGTLGTNGALELSPLEAKRLTFCTPVSVTH